MSKNNDNTNIAPVHTIKFRNFIDLLKTMDRTAQLAGMRSLASAIQFTLINTADWMIRKAAEKVPEDPTLDLRNQQDEFARYSDTDAEGNSQERNIAAELGFEILQTPEEKFKQYSGIYWALVDEIKALFPANEYERPASIVETLAKFTPRGVGLSQETLDLMKAIEMEAGEFDKARNDAVEKRAAEMATRKPEILQLIKDNQFAGDVDQLLELPVHVQLRLATSVWKGLYFRRKGLVTLVSRGGDTSEMTTIKLLQAHLEQLEAWCREFEHQHRDVLEVMIEADIKVYTIDDAKADVKKPRN